MPLCHWAGRLNKAMGRRLDGWIVRSTLWFSHPTLSIVCACVAMEDSPPLPFLTTNSLGGDCEAPRFVVDIMNRADCGRSR